MNNEAFKEAFSELFSHLERLETQSEAILQFLKEKKRVTDKQLAPYLEQAGNASNVRWRAARVRIEHLLSSAEMEEPAKTEKRTDNQLSKNDLPKDDLSKKTQDNQQPQLDQAQPNAEKQAQPVTSKEPISQANDVDVEQGNSKSAEQQKSLHPTKAEPAGQSVASQSSDKQSKEDHAMQSGNKEEAKLHQSSAQTQDSAPMKDAKKTNEPNVSDPAA